MQGDLLDKTKSANSSSCGERIVHSMLSIGRRFVKKKPSIRDANRSVERNVWGLSTSKLLG